MLVTCCGGVGDDKVDRRWRWEGRRRRGRV